MNPTRRDYHQDAVLTAVSIKYANGDSICDTVFPRVKVAKESDKYYKYVRNFRLPKALRAIGSESNAIDYNLETDSYFCEEYALHGDVHDRERKNADVPLKPDIDCTENVVDALTLLREKRVADIAFNAAVVLNNTTLAGVNQWSDYAGSDPLGDIAAGIYSAKAASGKKPNLVVMGEEVMIQLEQHPDILERIKFTQKGVITADLLSSLLPGAPRVVVGDLMYDDSQEGDSEDLGYIWGKKVLIAYAEASPGIKKISFGYQFYHQDRETAKWREDRLKGDRIEVTEVADEHTVAAACAYLIVDAVA